MFGISLIASLIVIHPALARLVVHKSGAARSHDDLLHGASIGLFALLLAAWLLVAARTRRRTATGRLFLPMTTPGQQRNGCSSALRLSRCGPRYPHQCSRTSAPN
jgi:hypothetical protein